MTATPTLSPADVPNRTPPEATAQIKFHASLNVSDLDRSVRFYAALLGADPVKWYPDYAKFEIDVPPLVLSLKPKRACAGGPLNHLGLRLMSVEHLRENLREYFCLTGSFPPLSNQNGGAKDRPSSGR